jgi:1-acyl-sn-glycerol-3-phosphate acyltransferase
MSEHAPAPDLPVGSSPVLHDVARWVGTWVFRPVFRLRWHGARRVPAQGPVVLVANHSAFVDGPLLFGMFDRRAVFLVKQEMFRGVAGWVLPRIGQLAVRRGEPDRAPLLAAQRVLRGGGLVAVFPEGTRGVGAERRGLAGPVYECAGGAGGLPGHAAAGGHRAAVPAQGGHPGGRAARGQ